MKGPLIVPAGSLASVEDARANAGLEGGGAPGACSEETSAMARTLYLSYSAFNQFKSCARQYYNQRVLKLEPPERDSKHNAIFGTVIQAAFEKYYNERMWEGLPLGLVEEELQDFARTRFFKFLEEEYVNWKSPSCRTSAIQIQEDLTACIPHVLSYLHEAGLHGPTTASEVDFKTPLTEDISLVGFVDFIIKLPNGEVLILDGKSTKDKTRVDADQLRYYALMFFLRYHTLPTRLGFLYYRFCDRAARDRPQAASPLDQGPIEWVPVVLEELMDLRNRLIETAAAIRGLDQSGTPAVNPSPKVCQYCQWEHACPERQAQRAANAAKRGSKTGADAEADFAALCQAVGVPASTGGAEEIGFSGPVTAKGRLVRGVTDQPAPLEGAAFNPLSFLQQEEGGSPPDPTET